MDPGRPNYGYVLAFLGWTVSTVGQRLQPSPRLRLDKGEDARLTEFNKAGAPCG